MRYVMDSCEKLNEVFRNFSITAKCIENKSSDHYEIFNLQLTGKSTIAKIERIGRELQLALRMNGMPVFLPNYAEGFLQMVFAKTVDAKLELKDIFKNKPIQNSICQIGISSVGEVVQLDITNAPHLLVVGTTGSGKSVFLNVLIANFVAMGNDAEVYLIDPKEVEFAPYNDAWKTTNIIDVYYSYFEALHIIKTAVNTMKYRYKWLSEHGYKSVQKTNGLFKNIYIIIDEIGDLIQKDTSGEFATLLCELARKSRAAGIHLIIASQRATTDVINGHIKANFPARVIFKVASAIESRIIMDMNGAESLGSRGDGIIFGYEGSSMIRFKSAFVEQSEVLSYARRLRLVA